jgi:SagB-type dehydrogenase family enzyme
MANGLSVAERYHEATKYTPATVGRQSALDLSRQPRPFKEWHQPRRIPLGGGPGGAMRPSPGPLDPQRLGRLLHHTYGVTLVREMPGASLRLRAAPSAGALYPTEVYVAAWDIEGIPDGILDYQAFDHSLVACWEGDFRDALARYAFDAPVLARARAVLILTGVFERSAWRYRDRAYRRVLLDTGHVMGNAMLAARADGLTVVPIPAFHDEAVDELLLLDGTTEGTLLLAAIVDGEAREGDATVPARSPRRADVATPEGAWIPVMHRAAATDVPTPPDEDVGTAPSAASSACVRLDAERLPEGPAVLAAIRRRRSTRSFRRGPLPLDVLGRILAHAYPRDPIGRSLERIAPGVLDTWLVVADVPGLEPGVWRYHEGAHALERTRSGDPRRALHEICLLQELGRDASACVVHAFDLPAAVRRWGERAYRYAHLDAGVVGERLDLAALRLGYGASGIGGFFDEMATDLLGVPRTHAVAYLTTLGLPA